MVKFKKGDIMNRFFALSVLFLSAQISYSNKPTDSDHRAADLEDASRHGADLSTLRRLFTKPERMGEVARDRNVVAAVVEEADEKCPDYKLGGRMCCARCLASLCPPRGNLSEDQVNSCWHNPGGTIGAACLLVFGSIFCGCKCCDSPK